MVPGPLFFAWVNVGDFVWDEYGSFAREDEIIVDFEVTQAEGDFAALTINIRNPKIGLLSTTRKVWAWLSFDRAWTGPNDEHIPDIVPLFFGRLVGIPTNINQEIVTLTFTARPNDFVAQKQALAETLKVAPFYNKIWLATDKQDDPDSVIEARPVDWAIDRVTGAVTVSNFIVGEDGLQSFAENEVPYDSVQIALNQSPLRQVNVDATINWTQAATGSIPIVDKTFETYCGDPLLSDWAKVGGSLGGGWAAAPGTTIEDVWGVKDAFTSSYSSSWKNIEEKHEDGDTMSRSESSTIPVLAGPGEPYVKAVLTEEIVIGIGDAATGLNNPGSVSSTTLYVLRWLIHAVLNITFDASRARTEHIQFSLNTNVQSIVTDAEGADVLTLTLSSLDVGVPIDGVIPIGDTSRSQFITTHAGTNALEYLIMLARANLLSRSRAVQVTFAVKFARAIQLSCRMNALIVDDRLPGGQAVGKIVSYSFKCDPSNGDQFGTVTIACAIGYGASVAAVAGDPQYVEVDYVDNDYQEFANTVVVLGDNDVGYSIPVYGATDDGLRFPLTKDQVVIHEEWHGSIADQEAALNAAFPNDIALAHAGSPFTIAEKKEQELITSKTAANAIADHSIWYDLQLKPVAGNSFDVAYPVTLTALEVPQQINLEAG